MVFQRNALGSADCVLTVASATLWDVERQVADECFQLTIIFVIYLLETNVNNQL